MLDDLLGFGRLWWGWLLARGWGWGLLAWGRWGLLDVGRELHGWHVHGPLWGLVLWLGGRLWLGGWGRWLELLLHRGVGWRWQGRRGLGLHLHGRE